MAFVAKYRCRVFDAAAIDVLRAIFADVCSDAYATLVERDGEDNQVQLLLEYPPKAAVSSLVNNLKGVSSRLLNVIVICLRQFESKSRSPLIWRGFGCLPPRQRKRVRVTRQDQTLSRHAL